MRTHASWLPWVVVGALGLCTLPASGDSVDPLPELYVKQSPGGSFVLEADKTGTRVYRRTEGEGRELAWRMEHRCTPRDSIFVSDSGCVVELKSHVRSLPLDDPDVVFIYRDGLLATYSLEELVLDREGLFAIPHVGISWLEYGFALAFHETERGEVFRLMTVDGLTHSFSTWTGQLVESTGRTYESRNGKFRLLAAPDGVRLVEVSKTGPPHAVLWTAPWYTRFACVSDEGQVIRPGYWPWSGDLESRHGDPVFYVYDASGALVRSPLTGEVLRAPRSRGLDLSSFPEDARPGIFLLGGTSDPSRQVIVVFGTKRDGGHYHCFDLSTGAYIGNLD